MERNMDFNGFSGSAGFNGYDNGLDQSMYEVPMISPVMQYEQACMYYKYLTQQMEYKIKCKEYEAICKKS